MTIIVNIQGGYEINVQLNKYLTNTVAKPAL